MTFMHNYNLFIKDMFVQGGSRPRLFIEVKKKEDKHAETATVFSVYVRGLDLNS